MYVKDSETNQDILDELNTKSALTETLAAEEGFVCIDRVQKDRLLKLMIKYRLSGARNQV